MARRISWWSCARRRPRARYVPSLAVRLGAAILPEVKWHLGRQDLPLHPRQSRSRRWPADHSTGWWRRRGQGTCRQHLRWRATGQTRRQHERSGSHTSGSPSPCQADSAPAASPVRPHTYQDDLPRTALIAILTAEAGSYKPSDKTQPPTESIAKPLRTAERLIPTPHVPRHAVSRSHMPMSAPNPGSVGERWFRTSMSIGDFLVAALLAGHCTSTD